MPIQPVAVAVAAVRKGGSILLEITGVGRGHPEGGLFEDPETWSVEATAEGVALERLVNGPVRVARNPVGRADGDQWDVTVRFTVSFACPEDAGDVHVRILPPDSPPMETVVAGEAQGAAGDLGTVSYE